MLTLLFVSTLGSIYFILFYFFFFGLIKNSLENFQSFFVYSSLEEKVENNHFHILNFPDFDTNDNPKGEG